MSVIDPTIAEFLLPPKTGQAYFDLIRVPMEGFQINPDHKVNVPSVRVTPVMAETILKHPMRMQRDERRKNTKDIAEAIRQGRFVSDMPVVIGIVTTDLSPEGVSAAAAYLLDGQHRFGAVVETAIAHTFDMVFRTFPDEQKMLAYAITLDSQMKRNHHHKGKVAELDLKLAVGAHDAGAFEKGCRAIVREGLDPTSPFVPGDEQDKIIEIYDHYLRAGKMLFSLLHYGTTNPALGAKPISVDFMKEIRQITVFAPLLVWINKNSVLIRDFLVPVLLNNQVAIKPVQNVFVQMLRQGLIVRASEYHTVMGVKPEPNYFKSGNKSQRRNMMATLLMLDRFRNLSTRSRPYQMTNLAKEAFRMVDRVILSGTNAELDWPSPVEAREARAA